MPTDASGNYALPNGYLAVTGEIIEASQHNPPLEDLAAAMSARLPRNGSAPMTSPLKASAGSASAPSLTFAAGTTSGLYPRADGGLGLASLGVDVGAVAIGSGIEFWGTTAPPGWAFPYGQAFSRTTYDKLFAAYGTIYGSGDGSTTFNVPDKRGRLSIAKDDMGGSAANRVTNGGSGIGGSTLGAPGGAESVVIAQANLPSVNFIIPSGQGSHNHAISHNPINGDGQGGTDNIDSGTGPLPYNNTIVAVQSSTLPQMIAQSGGSGTALNKMPPGIVCNYIIFTGVYA